jgi:molecular chaperone HtpG
LPQYFRFVVGVVDSEDMPLNVSRESVQSNRVIERVRTVLTNRLIDELERLAAEEPDKYRSFWKEFGPFLKEGISLDPAARTKLDKLLRFPSSKTDGDRLTSLAQYVERMQPDQKAIYYLIGSDVKSASRSPHLDYFRKHDLEVLYMVDPLDSFLTSVMRDFDGKPLQNVDDAGLDLPKDEPPVTGEALNDEELKEVLDRFRTVLGERVVEVQEGKTLSDSLRLVRQRTRSIATWRECGGC